MGKVRKLKSTNIRKITGGKDPARVVEEFMVRCGIDPDGCLQQRTTEIATWSIPLSDDEELEITLEGLSRIQDTTLYMGINVYSVGLQNLQSILVAALTVADTLIGAKLSLVNYDLVLSVTVNTADMGVDDIDYYYGLIMSQKSGVQDAIADEVD